MSLALIQQNAVILSCKIITSRFSFSHGIVIITVLLTVCSEVAFGYKGLQIQLYYTAGNLSTLFKVKYSSKVNEVFDCVEVRRLFLMLYPCAVIIIS